MSRTVAVVGTGAAGLTATAHLARRGIDVVALERNSEIGGLLTPFEREGYEFSPGVHYVGQCRPNESFGQEFVRLEIDPEELFAPMDDDFDVYRFPDFEIAMRAGVERYRDRLAEAFPDDTVGVDRVMRAVDHILAAQRLQSPGPHRLREYLSAATAIPLIRWTGATLEEYLDWACSDDRLKSVLAAQCGDYGLPPSRAAATVGLAVLAHYINGAWYPRGGAGALRDALAGVGEEHGARFQPSSEVTDIEVEEGRAVSIRTADGTHREIAGVIAAVDPRHVYGRMLDREVVPEKTTERLPSIESSLSALVLYLGLDRDLREDGWGAANLWDYPTWDIEATYAAALDGELPDDPFFFISPNSLKDPTGSMAPEGKTAVEVVTIAPWELVERWEDVPPDERGPEFESLKARLTETLLVELGDRHPELVSDIEVCELSTPLAFRHHVDAIEGGLYGPAQTPDQALMSRFSIETGIDRLVLAGQGVLGGGVSAAMMSGRLAAETLASKLR